MKYFKLINGGTYHIDEFEDKTNRELPYYQNGSRYALCPTCGSSIQLIGGGKIIICKIELEHIMRHIQEIL